MFDLGSRATLELIHLKAHISTTRRIIVNQCIVDTK